MGSWEDLVREAKGEQPASNPASEFDRLVNEAKQTQPTRTTGETQQPTSEPQTTVLPEQPTQDEPFQLRMAKKQATENEIRRRVQEMVGGLAESSVKDTQQKRANQATADKEYRSSLWNFLNTMISNAGAGGAGVIASPMDAAEPLDSLREAKQASDKAADAFERKNFFERQGHELSGWGQRYAGNVGNTFATMREEDARSQAAFAKELEERAKAQGVDYDYSKSRAAQQQEKAAAVTEKRQTTADEYAHRGEEKLQLAKDGLGAIGRLGMDVETGALDLGADALANTILPGSGMEMMGIRVFGEAAREEREKGGDLDKQMLAGTKAAAIEVLTEKIGGPFEKIYGKSFAGKAINKAIDAIDSTAGRRAIKILSDALGEGAEEVLSDLLNPTADYLLGLSGSWDEAWSDTTLESVLYDGLLGTLLGAAGSAGQIISAKGRITPEDIQQIKADAQATGENAVQEAAQQAAPAAAKTPTQSAEIEREASGDIPAPPATENAATGESERLNLAPVAEEAEAAQTAPEQTAMQPTTAAEPTTAAAGIAPVEQSGENGTVTGEEIALPGMKRSQTESNTLSGVAEKLGGEQNPLYYMPVTERQTLNEAVNRVMTDGIGEMERLADKEHWTAADVDTAMTLYGKLQADGVQNRDFGAAQSWAKVIQSRGTSTAQALQAFSKWTRSGSGTASAVQQQLAESVAEHETSGGRRGISQEQADQITNDVYKFAQEFDGLTENDAAGLRDLIRRMSDYRKTGTLIKKNFAKVLDKITDADYLREFALRQMSAIADDATVQADLGQKLKTWQTLAQLLRLTTFNRNIGGNLTFGTLDTLVGDSLGLALDHLAGKVSGKREVGFDKGWFSSKAREAAVDALNRSVLEVAGDIDMSGDMNRYGRTSARTFKMTGTPLERALSRLEQVLSYSLTTSDKVFRGKTEAAQTEALEGIKENAPNKEGAADIAEATADYRLFQNKGTAYGISKGIHDILNLAGIGGTVDKATPQRGRQGGFGLGDVVNTYPGVPANLGVKVLEYSPANIAKGAVEFAKVLKDIKYGTYEAGAQNKAVMDMARGLAGVPILTALAAAFKTGLIKNWDDEDDLDAAAQNRAEGKTGVQINLDGIIRAAQGEDPEWRDGDAVMSVSWLEPLNAFLAVSSLLAADDSDDPAVSKYMKHTFNGAIQGVLDLPVMENISNLVDTFKYSTAEDTGGKVWDATIGLAGDALTGMIPGVSGQLARTIDPYYRDVTADSKVQQIWNNVKNVIPGLRETLPVKQDNYGEPKMAPDSAVQRALNNFILPGTINQIRQSDVSAAVNSLYEATGDANVVPDRKAPNSINVNGKKYTLSAEEKRDYQETYGNAFADAADRLLNTDEFAGLPDETKAEAMKQLEQIAAYEAKKDYLKQQGVDYAESAKEEILSLADEDPDEAVRYLTAREAINGATEDRDYDVLDQLLGEGGAYHNLSEEAQDMLSSIDGLKRLVSMRGDGVSAENAMKAIDAIKGLKTQDEQTAAIVGLDGMSNADKIKSLKACTSEEYAEKVKTAYDSGVSLEEWSRVYAARQRINKGEGTAQNKATDFAAWLDKNTKLTAAQKDIVQDQLSFYSMNKAEPTHYDGLRESKVNEDTARRIANAMTQIRPLEGKTQATQEQKVDTILGMGLSDGDTWAALKEYTSESYYNKAAEAYRRGVDLDDYVRQFREADLPNDKGETNGQLSQDELWKYYKANPGNETFVKVMWMIGGFKTDWDTYKRKHR